MTDANDPESTDSCSLTEEEVEPKLKYVRLSNDLKNILSEEAISCIAVHSRFLCLGTHWGRIHMLDHQGNRVETLINLRQNPHILSVNKISVDSKGEYIGTCSDDGMAIINGLYTDENNQKLNVGKVIRAVELDPLHYKSGSGRRFLIGDHKLVLYERTFLKGLKSTILSESEGAVSAIKWNGQFIAWASSLGVHVYDLSERCSLGLIKWEEPKEGKLTDFRCNLSWSNSTTLLIGWVDTIRICVIRKRNPIEVSTRNLPAHIVDPMSTFQTEFYVCGVAPLESHQLVVLGYPKDRDSETNKALRPILCVLQYKASDYIEICTDSLSMRGYQEYKCDDYHLDCLIEENQYFIVSPKDVVVASLYETDDRVQWLIEHGCEQWVEFCCCAQTAETFYTGGVFALKSSYLICGDHFEAGAFLSPPARSLLVPGAVPRLKPGRTLPTAPPEPAEFGFVEEEAVEVVVKQEDAEVGAPEPTEIVRVVEVAEVVDEEEVVVKEEIQQEAEEEQMQVLEATQFPDEVLVEMLDPEEIKEEILPEFEEVEPVMMEELPSNECEIIELEDEVEVIKRPQHQSDCIFATGKLSNFEERYKRQIRQNKNTESQIELEKLNYSQMAEKCRKANNLLAAKIRKKQQLQRKLKEYKRIGPEALLGSMESFNAKSCDEGSDSSVDEANAWW